jgi:hypothetical protein
LSFLLRFLMYAQASETYCIHSCLRYNDDCVYLWTLLLWN